MNYAFPPHFHIHLGHEMVSRPINIRLPAF
ncbi:MAG: hypothetical protein JWO03_3503 [Bacteroidetes bacterium]|nr:hypothetical protein [Bacteroidota bacterium]